MRHPSPELKFGRVEKDSAARGVLKLEEALERIQLERSEPCEDLKPWVLHFWRVSWDLGDDVWVQENVPHPSVHASFEDDEATNFCRTKALLTGVWPKNYVRRVTGRGRVIGIAFRPAKFQPWLGAPVSTLTGKVVALESFGPLPPGLTQRVLDSDLAEAKRLCQDWLLARVPSKDPWAERLSDLIEKMRTDRDLKRTGQASAWLGVEVRTLQRLFLHYVGVGPKWIALRYRVHEALDLLRNHPEIQLGDLAQDLGYFDQAHFVHEFKRMTGQTPESYRSRASYPPEA